MIACELWRMTSKTTETLETQVERVVREYLAQQQVAARVAVERAFAAMVLARPPPSSRGGYKRRAPTQVAELAERLWEAVRACPGETMSVIAARVGEAPQSLSRPMQNLKLAGRVRSAGERNFTRYYPMQATKNP
jgi:hypothetical protein